MTMPKGENGASLEARANGTPSSHDQGLTEPQLLGGLADQNVVCGFDAVATYGVATMPYQRTPIGGLPAELGALTGVIWRFAMSSRLVWRSG